MTVETKRLGGSEARRLGGARYLTHGCLASSNDIHQLLWGIHQLAGVEIQPSALRCVVSVCFLPTRMPCNSPCMHAIHHACVTSVSRQRGKRKDERAAMLHCSDMPAACMSPSEIVHVRPPFQRVSDNWLILADKWLIAADNG